MAEGEGKANKAKFPTGFRFTPTSEELVRYYLLPRLQGRPPVPNDAVIEANVYLWHPDRLIGMYRDRGEDSWYFLSPRARKYTNGDRPSRNTEDGLGRWKASTGMSEGKGTVDGGTKFCHRVLAYHNAPIKTETKTKWLMQELTIPEYEKKIGESSTNPNSSLDEYVMCKIYVTPRGRRGKNDDEAGPSGVCKEACPPAPERAASGPAVESGQAGSTSAGPPKLSEKQAGKRRVEEKPGGAASTPKRARQHNQAPSRTAAGPPAPLHGGGTQAPSRTAPGHYVRLTAYNVRAPMPRSAAYQRPTAPPGHCIPPVAYNGMRVPVQQQPVAYNGQARPPVQRPQTVPYNSGMRMPVQQQTVAYNGIQVPVQRPHTVAYNGQARAPVWVVPSPPYQAANAPGPCGHGMPMMWRPSNPSGQAVKPPSVSRPPPRREQAETEEQRAARVYRQHVEEWERLEKERRIEAYAAGQQPYVGAGVNNHHAPAMAPPDQLPPYNLYTGGPGQQSQLICAVPATSGSGGAEAPAAWPRASVSGTGDGGNGECDMSNYDDKKFVELGTVETQT